MRVTHFALGGICFSLLAAASAGDTAVQKQNRLAKESSPYLLLHAHNPVDWYPWGPEAFEKAKAEDKPIFLSVGYSSCYWCHVMERKVFSDSEIAAYMNTHFVNIKVDREERPDVDDIYMTSLIVYQQLSGSRAGGGWPLSMFLTPSGNPIAGATYLPPAETPDQGRSFPGVAKRVTELWGERRSDIERSGEMIAEQVQRLMKPGLDLQAIDISAELVTTALNEVKALYDPEWGGVDFDKQKPDSPRFPNVTRLELALDMCESGDTQLLEIVEQSLQHMAQGGIRDHLAGGFHRYSTDRSWHVPHFEKMLYDQAMLLGIYTRAFEKTGKQFYAEVASEISDFVQRELTTPEGAFCSALDAETNAIEGEYYVWTREEIEATLGKEDAEIFSLVYGLKQPNPFEHGFVLHLPKTLQAVASELKTNPEELEKQLDQMRSKLLVVRAKRERPLLDDKVLTAWNALMIRTLAESGRVLNRPQDILAASTAAEFVLNNLRSADGQLLRTWRSGEAKYAAYLDDYAFLVAALLELNNTTKDSKWLTTAKDIAKRQNDLFYDESLQAFYYTAKNHEKLIARTSSIYDSVFPSANSVSIRNLIHMDTISGSVQFAAIAENTMKRFAPALNRSPASCAGFARAINQWLSQPENLKPVADSSIRHELPTTILTALSSDEKVDESATTHPAVIQQASFRPVLPNASGTSAFDEADKPKPLKVKIYPLYSKLPVKGKCTIAIELQIKRGWHINANPSKPDFLVPTSVVLKSKQKVKLTRIKYPEHHELQVDGSDEPYHVYDGKAIIYCLLETDEKDTTKFSELEFQVNFQGCNSSACLQPDKVLMKGKLEFAAEGEELQKTNPEKWPKLPAKDGEKAESETGKKADTTERPFLIPRIRL